MFDKLSWKSESESESVALPFSSKIACFTSSVVISPPVNIGKYMHYYVIKKNVLSLDSFISIFLPNFLQTVK